MNPARISSIFALAAGIALGAACGKKVDEQGQGEKPGGEPTTAPKPGEGTAGNAPGQTAKAGPGVDLEKKTLSIGALNDESGPAAAIGKKFAAGKRLLVKVVNAGGSGLMPEGWKLDLVERDHAYNPQKSVQEYGAIKNDVLFIATSFGTPNTLPLREHLERDNIVAFPASLSSAMAEHAHTPPLGPSYRVEAMRAMDWAVQDAGGADKVKAAIVYQKDDYGQDGLDGWKKAAEHHGIKIVSEQTVDPGQKDATAVVTALKKSGANYVLLTVLPGTSGAVIGTSAAQKYTPKWIGNTPAWIDVFFAEQSPVPAAAFGTFHWVTGITYWGEDVPGMDQFLAAWEKHGGDLGPPDFYIMASYVQGLVQLEAFKRALAKGDVTRDGYKAALQSIDSWDGGGMFQPVNLSKVPYVTSTQTRILKPNFQKKTWDEVADYAAPAALGASPPGDVK